MKRFAAMLALAALTTAAAVADTSGAGLQGRVVSLSNGRAIAHATVLYYKAPYLENGPNQIFTQKTDKNGYFTDITLVPGRYIVMARVPNRVEGCAVDDVQQGEVTHVVLKVGGNRIICAGPRVHPTTVDPNLTADLYRI
jgi:protocatechuate 3,4-dioxygenase beta subunit